MMMLVGFKTFIHLDFNLAFCFAVLSGVLYAVYMLLSKSILDKTSVLTFMTISVVASAVSLGILSYRINEPFAGFSSVGWIVLVVQGVVCQLLACMVAHKLCYKTYACH